MRMIETIDQLIEYCQNKKSVCMEVLIETQGTDNPYSDFIHVNSSLLVEILQVIKSFKNSQVEVEIDKDHIEKLINSAVQSLSMSIPSIEGVIETAEKKVQ